MKEKGNYTKKKKKYCVGSSKYNNIYLYKLLILLKIICMVHTHTNTKYYYRNKNKNIAK